MGKDMSLKVRFETLEKLHRIKTEHGGDLKSLVDEAVELLEEKKTDGMLEKIIKQNKGRKIKILIEIGEDGETL